MEHGLTRKEFKIVEMLVAGKSSKQIAFELGITLSTFGTHRSNIYRKLQVNNHAELIQHFMGSPNVTLCEREDSRIDEILRLLKEHVGTE